MVYTTSGKSRLELANDVVTGLSIIVWLGVLYYAFTQGIDRILFTVIFLGSIILVYLGSELIDAYEEKIRSS